MDWFLYDRDLHHDRVKSKARLIVTRVPEAFSEPCQTSKRERERERERKRERERERVL